MARTVITPSTFANNALTGLTFTSLNSTQQGWYIDASDMHDLTLIGYSTHTSAVAITVCAGTSESGTDFIYKSAGDLTTSIGSSGISTLFIDTARFKSTGGIYIDCATSGATAIQWAAIYRKPTL